MKRKLPLLLAGTALTLALGALAWFHVLQKVEWMTYDWRVQKTFVTEGPPNETLGMVGIDEETLAAVNKIEGHVWPLPRDVYARVIRELKAQGARTVAMDIFFIDEDPRSKGRQLPWVDGGTISPDALFAHEVKAAGNVILGAPPHPQENRLMLPLPLFRSGASLGHAIGAKDDDGVLRRVKPYVDDPEAGRVWMLGIALAARGIGADLSKAQVEPHHITLTAGGGQQRILPLDDEGMLTVNWTLPLKDKRFRYQPMIRLIASDARRGNGGEVKNFWKDRLVVIGSTAAGNNVADIGATPLDKNAHLASTHWNVAASILTGRQITPVRLPAQIGLITLMVLLAGFAAAKLRAVWALLTVILLCAGYGYLCLLLFTHSRVNLPMVLPMAGALLMIVTCLMLPRRAPASLPQTEPVPE